MLLKEQGTDNYLINMLNYTIDQGEVKDLDLFLKLIKQELPQEVEERVMTIAEQLTQRGLQRGLQQGLQQGEALLLIKQLNHRFGNLSSRYFETVKNADSETILLWGEKILDAEKLEDVFED